MNTKKHTSPIGEDAANVAMIRGIHELSVVVESLRETGSYTDEEGESMNALDDLLSILRSAP